MRSGMANNFPGRPPLLGHGLLEGWKPTNSSTARLQLLQLLEEGLLHLDLGAEHRRLLVIWALDALDVLHLTAPQVG